MGELYEGVWHQGRRRDFVVGARFAHDRPIRSLSVSPGECVTIHETRSDKSPSLRFYRGDYPSLHHKGGILAKNEDGERLIVCAPFAGDEDALLDVQVRSNVENGYRFALYRVPPGEYPSFGSVFPNDGIESIDGAASGVVFLYTTADLSGRAFRVAPLPRDETLSVNRVAGSLKYVLDEWESVGMAYGAIEKRTQVGRTVGASRTVRNDGSEKATFTPSVSSTAGAAFFWEWSAKGGVTPSQRIFHSGGIHPMVIPNTELTEDVASGQSRTYRTTVQRLSASRSIVLDPGVARTVDLVVSHYTGVVSVNQTLRNKRTGNTLERSGRVHVFFNEGEAIIKK